MADALTLEFETEAFRAWTEEAIRDLDREGARDVLRKLAFDFLGRVIPKTPVDTGRARAGWHSYLLKNGALDVAGAASRAAGGRRQAIQEGRAASSFEENFSGSEQSIVLVNGVEYVDLLEYGSSDQAPGGMVRISFREMRASGTVTKELSAQLAKTFAQANRTARASRRRSLPR